MDIFPDVHNSPACYESCGIYKYANDLFLADGDLELKLIRMKKRNGKRTKLKKVSH